MANTTNRNVVRPPIGTTTTAAARPPIPMTNGIRAPIQVQPARPAFQTIQQPVQPRARTRSPAGTTQAGPLNVGRISVPGPGAPVPSSRVPTQQRAASSSTSPSSSSSSSLSSAIAPGTSVPAGRGAYRSQGTGSTPATTVSSTSSPGLGNGRGPFPQQTLDQKPRIVGVPPRPTGTGTGTGMGKPVGGDDYVMAGTGSPPLASVDSSSAVPLVAGAAGGAAGQAAKVPAFLNKLFSMINDMTTDPLIYWSEDGKSFFIPNAQQFGAILLPQFFKHRNFTSFVRQLNMYGFKKVPHLQSGVLSSFPQPTNELWEFSNPKFMRGHPELLGSITRKKSAKEMAASQAAQAASSKHGGGGKDGDEGDHDDEDVNMEHDVAAVHHATTSVTGKPPLAGDTSMVDPSAVNKALTVMHAHTSHLEKELAELKASNELLWRQAMVSREEQIKSQKKLDGVMRFLASQFGGMAVSLAAGEEEGDPGGTGMDGQVSAVRRLGKNRMIGDRQRGLAESDGLLGEDGHLWEDLEGNDKRDLWELGEDGEMVKVKNNLKRPTSRPGHPRSISTPNRHSFERVPGSQRGSQDYTPSKRFVSLEASPEETANQSFDGSIAVSPLGADVSQSATPTAGSPEAQTLEANTSNALTTYQHPGHLNNVNVQSFSLDPALLQLPLGTLLQTPAGAQLLANLSHAAADWVNQNAVAGKSTADAFVAAAAASPRPLSPRLTSAIASVATPVGVDRFQPVPSPSEQSVKTEDPGNPTPGSDMLWINDINDLFTNASAVDPAAQGQSVPNPSYMPPPVPAEPVQPVDAAATMADSQINWADPHVEALLNNLVADHTANAGDQHHAAQPFVDPAFDSNSSAPYHTAGLSGGMDLGDPGFEFDFETEFGNPMQASAISAPASSTEDSANTTPRLDQGQEAFDAINIMDFATRQPISNLAELPGGPTRKKRKTDQREP